MPNRERFIRRYKEQLKKAVEKKAASASIKDLAQGGQMKVRVKTTHEPSIVYGQGGTTRRVIPGNETFSPGDEVEKPQSGQGGGAGNEPGSGDSEENFEFLLTKDEFLGLYFNDLELPNLLAKQTAQIKQSKLQNAGYTKEGAPTQLSIVRTFKGALARKIALSADSPEIKALKLRIEEKRQRGQSCETEELELSQLLSKQKHLPFLDEIDLRYKNRVQVPKPATKAVMFCVMDVSASMSARLKELAKRFFMLLYLFLTSKYEDVELVFICHTDSAEEVDEYHFFHGHRTGGTEVAPALELADKIVQARYNPSEWNIYMAQSSDGDATVADSTRCKDLLKERLSRYMRHFSYVEVTDRENHESYRISEMMQEYLGIGDALSHEIIRIGRAEEVFPKFRKMFEKK